MKNVYLVIAVLFVFASCKKEETLVYISSDMRDIKNQVYESVALVSEDVEGSKLPFI